MSSTGKRKRALVALAESLGGVGATIADTKGNHLVIKLPNGSRVYTSATPSDWRADRRIKTEIRRSLKQTARHLRVNSHG
jgi:hypothetical protein